MRLFFLILAILMLAAPEAMAQKPSLINPQTIDIISTSGLQRFALDPERDYIVRVGKDTGGAVTVTEIKIVGGRNIVLSGARIKRADNTTASDPVTGERLNPLSVTLHMLGQTGTTFIENVLIDNNSQYGVDALDLGGADTGGMRQSGDFVMRGIHIRNVDGTGRAANGKGVAHADAIQLRGPVGRVDIERLTAYSSYQGLNLQPEFSIGSVSLRRVNLRYNRPGQADGYALWLGNGHEFANPATYDFQDVYVEARQAWKKPWQRTSIAPDSAMKGGARLLPGHADRATWPSRDGFSVTGYVTRGIPPGGDFCPANE